MNVVYLLTALRLHVRNKMALIYSYLFPTIFLVAFWVLYRFEQVPLVRHMGELLTVTALGGACFGLPTTMVSERERGVWRRYRLTPAGSGTLVAGTMAARYLLLGEAFGPEEAIEFGLVSHIAEPGRLQPMLDALVAGLRAKPAEALRLTQRLLRRDHIDEILERMALENGHFSERLTSSEVRDAITAFFAARGGR